MKKNNLNFTVFLMMASTNIIESFAELCMKMAVNHTGMTNIMFSNVFEFLAKSAFMPILWAGFMLYILNFFIWMVVLSRLDLSLALPIAGMSYILVPLLAKGFLHETLGPGRWIGIALIVLGVYCVSRSTKEAANE
jgi:drug/metabolite transporter (DMT)-like permease